MPHTLLNINAIPTTSLVDALRYIESRVTPGDYRDYFSLIDSLTGIPAAVTLYNQQHANGGNGGNGGNG